MPPVKTCPFCIVAKAPLPYNISSLDSLYKQCNLNRELYEDLRLKWFMTDTVPVNKFRSWILPRSTLITSWHRYPRPYRPANPFEMIAEFVTWTSVSHSTKVRYMEHDILCSTSTRNLLTLQIEQYHPLTAASCVSVGPRSREIASPRRRGIGSAEMINA
jgi:hypothetical protein